MTEIETSETIASEGETRETISKEELDNGDVATAQESPPVGGGHVE